MVIRENLKESVDELAITKAAAWAWYERGSWFEHKSIPETDCRKRSDYTCKPSRYKLEAMKNPQHETHEAHSCTVGSLLRTEHLGNSLLDEYEIERISRDLDCYIKYNDVKHRRKSVDGRGHGRIVSLPEGKVGNKRESKSKSEKRKGGFWIGHPVVCGSNRDDVVNSNLLIRGRRSQKEHVLIGGNTNFSRPISHGLFR